MSEHQSPPAFDKGLIERLPPEITAVTGRVNRVSLPTQGVCNLLLLLETEAGTFVLKVARGGYRSQELAAEHRAMQHLHRSDVPVPHSLAFVQGPELSFQLREYSSGEPLSGLLRDAGSTPRRALIRQMGETLAAIHAQCPVSSWTWEQWIEGSLNQAAANMAAGVIDPEDFTPETPPEAALVWLRTNRPASGGSVCLLHGDYRPKNLLWEQGKITGVIDWAFADVGDPYYDLSIIHWYMQDEAEWQLFLDAYGLPSLDRERFDYCMALHKFLNV